jgi:ABC-type sugar transport system ATPase subunit
MVVNLSGGNQQKVILGKWLMMGPKILFVDEPTKGIDVGTKADFYKILDDLANEGIAIIMVSSDMPELVSVSDRVLVMCNGGITGELSGNELTQAAVMKLAIKED